MSTPVELAAGIRFPIEIAVSEEYLFVSSDEGLLRVPIDGGVPLLLREGVARGLAVDDTHVYFTFGDTGGAFGTAGQILRMPFDGGPVQELANALPAPWPLAIDEDYLYSVVGYDKSSVIKMPKAGRSAPEVLASATNGTAFLPWSMAMDDDAIYWGAYDRKLRRVRKDGTSLAVIAQGRGNFLGMVTDGTHVFAFEHQSDDSFDLVRIPVAGADAEVIATGLEGNWAMTPILDDNYIYWTNTMSPAGVVMRVPREGTGHTPTILVPELAMPKGLAADCSTLYWTVVSDSAEGQGAVFKLTK